jgi:hypothetical protein|tara:strand:+ start:38 stop:472 length:435 start_codon:yes stop_codon:yes gene_type:complete
MAYKDKDKVFNDIIARIEQGESLLQILKSDGMPDRSTFFVWMKETEEKSNNYTKAMESRQDKMFDEILEIAYKPEEGDVVKSSMNGVETTTSDMLGHRRLKIDSLKWVLSRMNPKKFGDKVQQEHTINDITEIRLTDATTDINT